MENKDSMIETIVKPVPIREIFGVKLADDIDIGTFAWVGVLLIAAYVIKRSIDFFFDLMLQRKNK